MTTPMQPTPDSAAGIVLLPDLRAILDRPLPEFFAPRCIAPRSCLCAWCTATRAQGYQCDVCGYEGSPRVSACACDDQRANLLASCMQQIGEHNSGVRRLHRTELRRLERTVVEVMTEPTGCDPSVPDGARCAHGDAMCPVCQGGGGGWTDDDCNAHPWVIIRDLRAALAARGLV